METANQFPVVQSLTSTSNNLEALPDLLKQVSDGVTALISGESIDREHLLLKCRAMVQAIQTPRDILIDHTILVVPVITAINFGIDVGLWKLMAEKGDRAQGVRDLAATLGVDARLLGRILRHLAAMGYITETAADEYKPTNYSKALSLPGMAGGYQFISAIGPSMIKFHDFCRERTWRLPTDHEDTCLRHTHNFDGDFFAWMQQLGFDSHFNHYLDIFLTDCILWMDPAYYPVKERLVDGAVAGPEEPFLVDVGGGTGNIVAEFKRYHPQVPGQLILQDLPVVINQTEHLDASIVRMAYDFHTEQPVRGARAYYMRRVLHDWTDNVSLSILARVKAAMKPGYSRLLINERIIPSAGAYKHSTGLDMLMLNLFSSSERTRHDWYNLLEKKAGLRITGIWNSGRVDTDDLIECQLPSDA